MFEVADGLLFVSLAEAQVFVVIAGLVAHCGDLADDAFIPGSLYHPEIVASADAEAVFQLRHVQGVAGQLVDVVPQNDRPPGRPFQKFTERMEGKALVLQRG